MPRPHTSSHLKPLLTRLPQCAPPPPPPPLPIHAAAEHRVATGYFSADPRFIRGLRGIRKETNYSVRILFDGSPVMNQCYTAFPVIRSALDIFMSPRKGITVLKKMFVEFQFKSGPKCVTSRKFTLQLRGDRAVENAVNTV